jgi:peptidoglycan/xylan/chitin deacetylase (PgdA/CDA1 family)
LGAVTTDPVSVVKPTRDRRGLAQLARARRRWRARRPGPVVRRGDPAGGRRIALSFDDGPSQWTAPILDLLRDHGARASFFVLGAAVAGREEVLRRATREGHELGNHLFSHRDAERLSDREIRSELRATTARVEALGLTRPELVRPPYGSDPGRVARIAAGLGLGPVVLWSIEPDDWREDEPVIVAHVLEHLHPGAIVDLHDGRPQETSSRPTRDATVAAVARLLAELGARGYRFVTVSELLRR